MLGRDIFLTLGYTYINMKLVAKKCFYIEIEGLFKGRVLGQVVIHSAFELIIAPCFQISKNEL